MIWKPIESAPRDGTPVIVFDPSVASGDGCDVYVCRWAPRRATSDKTPYWVEADGEGYHTWNPTHWMSLPSFVPGPAQTGR